MRIASVSLVVLFAVHAIAANSLAPRLRYISAIAAILLNRMLPRQKASNP